MRLAATKTRTQVDARRGRHPRWASERGFTTFELMVALAAALVVIVIPLVFLVTSIRQSNGATSRALSATQAETGLQALTRDLREASSTTTFTWGASSASASFSIPTPGNPGSPESKTWDCSITRCPTRSARFT